MPSTIRFFVVVMTAMLSAIACWAFPTLFGDSGVVLTPTADVERVYTYSLALGATQQSVDGGPSATAYPIRLDYGVIPGAELFLFFSGTQDRDIGYDAFGGGGKIRLTNPKPGSGIPAIATGVRVTRVQNNIKLDLTDVYAVASTPMYRFQKTDRDGSQIRGHLGVEYISFSNDLDGNFIRPFASLSYEGYGGSSAAIEYLPGISSDGITFREETVSGVIRFPLTTGLFLEAGATRPYGIGDSSIFGSLIYRYGDNTYDEKKYDDRYDNRSYSPTYLDNYR